MAAGIGGAGEGIVQSNGGRGGNNKGLIAAMGEERSEAELFQRVRARLRAQVGEDVFNSWFARLELEEIVDDKAHLSVPTRFLCSWIQSNYSDKILETFKSENPGIGRLHLTVRVNGQARPRLEKTAEIVAEPEAEPTPASRPLRDVAAPKTDALSGSALDPKMTFDNFVPGASNEIALGIAKQVASAALNGTVSFNPVYIHSTVGLGKSHLLNAIAWASGAAEPHRNIVYLTADHFMYHFITAVQRQSAIALKDWLRRVDLLLIDDMQFLQGKSATEFGHTLGTLLTGAKQVVVAGDAPPRA
jgi:chromosomal replication initiator protein